jgi:hypothetical protein
MYRQNHPDAIYGAIASAPPVEDMTNNSNSAYYYNWNIWVSISRFQLQNSSADLTK